MLTGDLGTGQITTPEVLCAPARLVAGDVVWMRAGGAGPYVVAAASYDPIASRVGENAELVYATLFGGKPGRELTFQTNKPIVQLVDENGDEPDLTYDGNTSWDGGWILASLVCKDRAQCVVPPPRPPAPPKPEDPLDWWELLQIERPLLCLTFYALRWVCAAAVGVAYFS